MSRADAPMRAGSFNGATARRPWRTAGRPDRRGRTRSSFNGATARRPWRTSATLNDCRLRRPGFNGATARRPWRTARQARSAICQRVASMGPQPEGRGEHPRGRRAAPALAALQWGHSPKAVENATASLSTTPHVDQASMGPQPEGRGEPTPATAGIPDVNALQWGHSPKAVENCPQSVLPNTAEWASMGPQPEGRGEHGHGPRLPHLTAAASMGPQPEGRGERWQPVTARPAPSASFNGATARRPWRTPGPQVRRPARVGASMGPQPEGRGEPDVQYEPKTAPLRLQWGHSPKAVENRAAAAPRRAPRLALQWGHSPKAVENPLTPSATP